MRKNKFKLESRTQNPLLFYFKELTIKISHKKQEYIRLYPLFNDKSQPKSLIFPKFSQ